MYIELLKKLNKKALKKGDIPVSCLVIRNGKVIAKAYNNKYSKNNPLGHAEIIAIIKASKKLKTANLNDCELFVTLKPCLMCEQIIKEMRIKKVNYILENNKINHNKIIYNKIKNCSSYFEKELVDFFKERR